ncbi:hypothetical protein B0I37DRAFT_440845 [Chaetomium sp. MPI-CAGE-AT-0009]|nr:hypothetical protein B0I37DRAFT_440845 [Chaetomium sp. MPI-CAGE-AT-0009]
MHPVSVDSTSPFPNLTVSGHPNSPQQPENAEPETPQVGGSGMTDSGAVGGEYGRDDTLATRLEEEEDEGDAAKEEYLLCNETPASKFLCQPGPRPAKPFQKWMKTLHKRVLRQQEMLGSDGSLAPWLREASDRGSPNRGSAHHRHSSSDSSFAFVTAPKSVSISMAGLSLLTRSRKTTIRSSRDPRTERSSRASVSGPRLSEESYFPETQAPVDPAVVERALKRRRILEELISTEEAYVGDVRFLMNVYVTILASLPTTPAGLRSSVNQNLTDIVELHEELLGELRWVLPDSEYTQLGLTIQQKTESSSSTRGHRHWRIRDAVPEGRDGGSWLKDVPGTVAEPQAVAEVAKIFLKRMNRFFIYEEYGAMYELMMKDVTATHRTMPGWSSYQKGLEVLASSLSSAERRDDQSKRASTLYDLLVKPIQRVCKYPLLFSELLKHTPVIDCPYSHMEVENTLIRLREATIEINRATNDSCTKLILEKTWILQDRLAFPDRQIDAASRTRIRSFGHIRLCGALHVCWQTKDGASGQYMVALLYRDWLCLATAGRIDQIYTIQACIALGNIKVEETDNGRGLQCHSVLHSWKIVFLSDNQLYELILTACSPKEELEWRTQLRSSQTTSSKDQDQMQPDIFGFLSLNIKSLGTVFRKPGTIARKISIHRATTIGPKTPLYQVILKNTSATRESPTTSDSNTAINRSQSLLTTNSRVPVLAPARAERARLEALLSDVWTRDVLPFPGISGRSRSEHLVRASASSMMRKLSAVSITGSFSRRSASLASLHNLSQHQPKEKNGNAAATAAEIERRTTMAEGVQHGHAKKGKGPAAAGDHASPAPPVPSSPVPGHGGQPGDYYHRPRTATATTATAASASDPGSPGAPDDDDDGDGDADAAGGLEMAPRHRHHPAPTAAVAAATAAAQPRRASAPDELGCWRLEEEGEADEQAPAPAPAVAAPGGKSGEEKASPRPSLQRSHLSEMSVLGREAELKLSGAGAGRSGKGGKGGSPGGGDGGGGGGGGGVPLSTPPPLLVREEGKTLSSRSKSLRMSGKKLALAGVRRREAVAEGLRSLFRQGGC